MGIRKRLATNNLQKEVKGCEILKQKRERGEIRVNLHYNVAGEPLQRIIERNVKMLMVK